MDRKTAEIAGRFAKRLARKYSLAKVILFGSRARGDNFTDSDFDFIIVSDDFRGRHFTARMSDVLSFWSNSLPVEPLCYTTEEFEKKRKEIGIVRSASINGRVIV